MFFVLAPIVHTNTGGVRAFVGTGLAAIDEPVADDALRGVDSALAAWACTLDERRHKSPRLPTSTNLLNARRSPGQIDGSASVAPTRAPSAPRSARRRFVTCREPRSAHHMRIDGAIIPRGIEERQRPASL